MRTAEVATAPKVQPRDAKSFKKSTAERRKKKSSKKTKKYHVHHRDGKTDSSRKRPKVITRWLMWPF